MRVYLDDNPVEAAEPTLAAALEAGLEAAQPSGRVLIEVWADGQRVPDEQLTDPPEDRPYAEEIRLVSAEPGSLVKTVLMDVAEGLDDAQSRQQRAAELLQTGQTQPALDELSEALTMWENVRRAVQEGCSLMGLSLEGNESAEQNSERGRGDEGGGIEEESLTPGPSPRGRGGQEDPHPRPLSQGERGAKAAPGVDAAMINSLAEQLSEVKRALAEEDWATLADVLAYDLDEQAERWRQGLAALCERIG